MVSRDPFIEVFVITAAVSLLLYPNLRVRCRPEKFTQKRSPANVYIGSVLFKQRNLFFVMLFIAYF